MRVVGITERALSFHFWIGMPSWIKQNKMSKWRSVRRVSWYNKPRKQALFFPFLSFVGLIHLYCEMLGQQKMRKTNKESNYFGPYHPNIINHYNHATFFFLLMMGVHWNGWPDSNLKMSQTINVSEYLLHIQFSILRFFKLIIVPQALFHSIKAFKNLFMAHLVFLHESLPVFLTSMVTQ